MKTSVMRWKVGELAAHLGAEADPHGRDEQASSIPPSTQTAMRTPKGRHVCGSVRRRDRPSRLRAGRHGCR